MHFFQQNIAVQLFISAPGISLMGISKNVLKLECKTLPEQGYFLTARYFYHFLRSERKNGVSLSFAHMGVIEGPYTVDKLNSQ